jgi:glucosamine--fructose-6-phosphate aminotransferase (isomerizing)
MEELPDKIQRGAETTEADQRPGQNLQQVPPARFFLGAASACPRVGRALKLKEVSYVHAEGYPAGESKLGRSRLIDENFFVVFVATDEDPEARRYVANNISR